jgi:hypothetical protein
MSCADAISHTDVQKVVVFYQKQKETRYIQYEPLVNGSKDESIDYINN